MHRHIFAAALLAGALALPAVAVAQEPGQQHERNAQIQGFGGFTVKGFSAAPAFGGSVAVPLTRNIQVVGGAGSLNNLMSPTLSTLLDFTPFDARLSAFYGEAGVRFIASPSSHVRPYAEATAGFARLKTHFAGASEETDEYVNVALQFLDRTDPLLGLGTGVVLQTGPVFVDIGYRFNKILSNNVVQSALAGGDLGAHQFRLGLGVTF